MVLYSLVTFGTCIGLYFFPFILEYPNACKPQELDKLGGNANFLIKNPTNDNVLEVFHDPKERNASMYFAPNEHKDGQIWSWIQTLDTGYGYIGSQAYLQSSKKVLGSQSMNNFIWSLVCIYR